MAAVAPSPAAVIACEAESRRTSPAANRPGSSVRIQMSVGIAAVLVELQQALEEAAVRHQPDVDEQPAELDGALGAG